jgi:hypothetical protein
MLIIQFCLFIISIYPIFAEEILHARNYTEYESFKISEITR